MAFGEMKLKINKTKKKNNKPDFFFFRSNQFETRLAQKRMKSGLGFVGGKQGSPQGPGKYNANDLPKIVLKTFGHFRPKTQG